MDVDLYVEDESINSPFLIKSFIDEIIFERYLNFTDFLNTEENKIIRPNTYGEIVLGKKREASLAEKLKIPFILNKALKGNISVEEINKLRDKLVVRSEKIEDRERDPKRLKEALKKVESYLILNENKLPLVHFVYETKQLINEINHVMINDIESHVEGDIFFYDNYSELRNKIHIKSLHKDQGKVDIYIDIKPEIRIDSKVYFTKTITKGKQFEEQFNKCYNFLDIAIKNNKKVLWEFG